MAEVLDSRIKVIQEIKFNYKSAKKHEFENYLENQIGAKSELDVQDLSDKEIVINADCPTLAILDKLWDEYKSDHLNKMAEHYFITEELLKKFRLRSINLTTHIDVAKYDECRQKFLQGKGNLLVN